MTISSKLMPSKFDSYCSRCGKPIFKGDLIEYDIELRKAFCIACRGNRDKISNCKHRAVTKHDVNIRSSHRYSGSYRSGTPHCLICGEIASVDENKTMYIQTATETGRGHSYHGISVDSHIYYVKDEVNHPDLESLKYLYEIIADKNIDNQIKRYAENHIKRICDNLNIKNEVNLYKKEYVKNGCTISCNPYTIASPVYYLFKKINERYNLIPLFNREITKSIFNDLLNLHKHVYGDLSLEYVIIAYYMMGTLCNNKVPSGFLLALAISLKNYIEYESLESEPLEFKIHLFNTHITSSHDFLKYFDVDIEDKLATYINYLAINSDTIDAYSAQKCIDNCINFNKFNMMDEYVEDALQFYKIYNEPKRYSIRDYLEFENLIDLFEREFVKYGFFYNRTDVDDNTYILEYVLHTVIDSEKLSNNIIYDTISLCLLCDDKHSLPYKKVIRTWKPDNSYEWFGFYNYNENEAVCGFGNGEIPIYDIKRYLSILNNNIIPKFQSYL